MFEQLKISAAFSKPSNIYSPHSRLKISSKGVSRMIVCDLSEVDIVEYGRKIKISRKISGALGMFPGQTLFGSCENGSRRLFLSTVKLNPSVNYFRIFLEDVRGSLAKITELLMENNINILSGGAFSFGSIWVSEFIVDLKGVEITSEDISHEIEAFGGFVASSEITELFPKSFELDSTFEVAGEGADDMYLKLPSDFCERIGLAGESTSYALLKAWPQVKALFIYVYPPETRLVKITAKIRDMPGSLHKLANLIRSQVNLQAIDELHHDEVSGEWMAFGVLVLGELDELRKKARELPTIIDFEAEALGFED
jgi:hypothetical protein